MQSTTSVTHFCLTKSYTQRLIAVALNCLFTYFMSQNPQHDILPPQSSPNSKPWLWWLLTLAVMAAVLIYLQFQPESSVTGQTQHARGKDKDNFDAPTVVATVTAIQGDFPVYIHALGNVTALRTVSVRPRVDGELIKLHFAEGQMVKQGDLLAEIDPRPFQIQLQQASGQLQRDQALLKNAQIDVARYQTLLEQDSIAAQQTATQQALVKQYQGVVEMDQAQVNNAKLQLDYAQVTAPIAGRIGLRQVDQGNIVHANDVNGLLVITQLQPISVIFTLPEDSIQSLIQRWRKQPNLSISAFDRAGKTKLADGKLIAIDNQIDASTGTLKLKAQFDNQQQTLFANQFVNVKLLLDTLPNAVQIASAAIQHDSQGAFAYVINADKTAQIRRLELGPSDGDNVAILSGLTANDIVVVEGIDRLREGSKVDIALQNGQPLAAEAGLTPDVGDKKLRKRNH